MSLLKKLLGRGQSEKPPTPQEGIQRLREVEEMLTKKSEFLEAKIEQLTETAKKHGTKNKRLALQALKKKKRIEKQLTQMDGTLNTIEFQREALENATGNMEVFNVMGVASRALQEAYSKVDIDKVHSVMDDLEEQHELGNELMDALARPALGQDYDEDELEEELENMLQEDLTDELVKVGKTEFLPDLPSVDQFEQPAAKDQKKDDDRDLRELEMWMS